MVMLASDTTVTTIEHMLALPEDNSRRHELFEGVYVITPAPPLWHQQAVGELGVLMANHVHGRRDIEIFPVLVDCYLGPQTMVQPDITVFRVDPPGPAEWIDMPNPELVVEIPSPGTEERDRGIKRDIYQKAGIPEYWIVDIDSQLVERWQPTDDRPEIVREKITWQPDEDGATLTIDLVRLFDNLRR
jgi:Uma2 family endonuclease